MAGLAANFGAGGRIKPVSPCPATTALTAIPKHLVNQCAKPLMSFVAMAPFMPELRDIQRHDLERKRYGANAFAARHNTGKAPRDTSDQIAGGNNSIDSGGMGELKCHFSDLTDLCRQSVQFRLETGMAPRRRGINDVVGSKELFCA